jgi:hypothetical protein
MSIITINTRINQSVDVDIYLTDLIDYLTDRPTTEKVNFCAQIIKALTCDLKELSPEHLGLFKEWLNARISEISLIEQETK